MIDLKEVKLTEEVGFNRIKDVKKKKIQQRLVSVFVFVVCWGSPEDFTVKITSF